MDEQLNEPIKNPYVANRDEPQCMDCKWKSGTKLTDNCGCRPAHMVTPDSPRLHKEAFEEARELQMQELHRLVKLKSAKEASV